MEAVGRKSAVTTHTYRRRAVVVFRRFFAPPVPVLLTVLLGVAAPLSFQQAPNRNGSRAGRLPTAATRWTPAPPSVGTATAAAAAATAAAVDVGSSPTIVCLTKGRSSIRRQLSAAFVKPLQELNRNLSFAFRPNYSLNYTIVEMSDFSPPEVRKLFCCTLTIIKVSDDNLQCDIHTF